MTRNDFLNSVDAEKKMKLIFEKWDFCCRQQLATSKDEKEMILNAINQGVIIK